MAFQPKTVVPQGIASIFQRFWQQSKALPSAAWIRWAKSLLVGLGICSVVAYSMTQIAMGWADTWLPAWDEKWLLIMQTRSPLSFSKGVTWESPGNLVGMLPVFFTLSALTAWFRQPLITATVIANYLGQFAVVWICWGTWSRDRPDIIADGLAAPSLHSFPSGHVVVAMTMYGLIFYLWARASHSWLERIIAIGFGVVWIGLIALSRLALGAHWPSDVIAGLILGSLWLITVITALERATALTKRVTHISV